MSLGLIHRRPVHPFVALRQAERALDRLNRRAATARPVTESYRSFDPRLEAVETEAGFEVTAEMPGVAREDLDVSVKEGVLTLSGVRRFGAPANAEQADSVEQSAEAEAVEAAEASVAEVADENVARFERRIRFNAEVDEDAISARYADGVLEVRIPKAMPPEPEVRTIPVEVG